MFDFEVVNDVDLENSLLWNEDECQCLNNHPYEVDYAGNCL